MKNIKKYKHINEQAKGLSIRKLADFIRNAVGNMFTGDDGATYYYNLGNGLACVICWEPGYGAQLRDDVIQSKSEPDWGLNIGIKVANSSYFVEDWVYLSNEDGELVTEPSTLSPEFDADEEAEAILKEYNDVKDLHWNKDGVVMDEDDDIDEEDEGYLDENKRNNAIMKKSINENYKIGDTIKIIRMDDYSGKDMQARKYNGRIGKIEYIDDSGQLHGTWGGLAIIPEKDDFELIKNANENKRNKINKKALYESIINSVAKQVKKALNEGAGAGYQVTLEGIEIEPRCIKMLRKEILEGKPVYIWEAKLKKCILNKWSAEGYYNGVTSDGIYYNNGELLEEFDENDRLIEGGIVKGIVYIDDVKNEYGSGSKQACAEYVADRYPDTISYMYGGGWTHCHLGDEFVLGDDNKGNNKYYNEIASTTYDDIQIIQAIVNAPNIGKKVDWFFDNVDDFDKIYFRDDDED